MSTSPLPYIIGNWKMNLDTESALTLAARLAPVADELAGSIGIGIAAPALWVPSLAIEHSETNLLIGAQDISAHDEGAFTGEISAAMVAEWASFTLIGHSERRLYHHETDELVHQKIARAFGADLTSLLCVGETEAEHDAGKAESVVARQLEIALTNQPSGALSSLIVAYEPVWSIGTGKTPSVDDVETVATHIRNVLDRIDPAAAPVIPILYGGSVKPGNASELLAANNIDGALVGGASLIAEDFLAIIESVA